jgi:hypothetical protein
LLGFSAALADPLDEPVPARQDSAGPLLLHDGGDRLRRHDRSQRSVQRRLRLEVRLQQHLQLVAQLGFVGALAVQERLAVPRVGDLGDSGEKFPYAARVGGHGKVLR